MPKKSVYAYNVPSGDISLEMLSVSTKNATKILMIDNDGDRLTLHGSGLTYKNGMLKDGQIDGLTIRNSDGKLLASATNLDIDVKTLPTGEPPAVFEYGFLLGTRHHNVMRGSTGNDELNAGIGNDVLKGRGGDDQLTGHRGNDTLTGGDGEDRFVFRDGDGKDRITDFDADFGDGKQDLIGAAWADVVSIKNVKGHAVVDFDGGDTITLLGVKANEIDASDFVL